MEMFKTAVVTAVADSLAATIETGEKFSFIEQFGLKDNSKTYGAEADSLAPFQTNEKFSYIGPFG